MYQKGYRKDKIPLGIIRETVLEGLLHVGMNLVFIIEYRQSIYDDPIKHGTVGSSASGTSCSLFVMKIFSNSIVRKLVRSRKVWGL